jgi:hypothetical protein
MMRFDDLLRFRNFLLPAVLGIAACSPTASSSPTGATRAPLHKGVIQTPHGSRDIEYEVRDGRAIFEGDIVLGKVDEKGGLTTQSAGDADASRRFNVGLLWPNGQVYYRYDPSINSSTRAVIQKAVDHINARSTNFLIEDSGKTHADHILYTVGSGGCDSAIGRTGSEQNVNLGSGCEFFDIVVHETGHAMGLIHEQSRRDRDQYVDIKWDNIQESRKSQFDIDNGADIFSEYDVESVMHYDSFNSFAIDQSKPTITRKDGTTFNSQDGKGLSDGDVRGLQIMYGAPYENPATAISWGAGRLDVFGRGTDGAAYHKYFMDGAWGPSLTGWEGLGGFIRGTPEAVSWAPWRLDVFAIGGDHRVYHKWQDGGPWLPSQTDWESLGGNMEGGGVSAVAWGKNRLDLFARGADGQLYHKYFDGSRWLPSFSGDWEPLGGALAGPVKVVSWGPNRLDIFAVGTDSAVYHKAYDNGTWFPSKQGYDPLGGQVHGRITAASWAAGRLDIFVQGNNDAVYHKWWDGSWGPSQSDWENLGGTFVGTPNVSTWAAGRLDLFIQGLDGKTYHKWFNGSWAPSLTAWESLGGQIEGSPVAVSWAPGRIDVFARGRSDEMTHKWLEGGNWGPGFQSFESLGGAFSW